MRALFVVVAVVVGVVPVCRASATPVVLVPGFLGQRQSGVMQSYFPQVKAALQGAGVDVTEVAPPPVASSEERGRAVLRAIDAVVARTGVSKVVVITHSQGGVDIRAALAEGGADHIAAVATIAAPHAGTGVADTALTWPRFMVSSTLDALAVASQTGQGDDATAPDAGASLTNLSRDGMMRFDATHPAPAVPFFSVAGYTGAVVDDACDGGKWEKPDVTDAMNPLLVFGTAMIHASWGRVTHDGIVPTISMRYGTFLGCVAADHFDWEGFDSRYDDRGPTDTAAFVLELYRGLDDVAKNGANAMDSHIDRLAFLAHARPRFPGQSRSRSTSNTSSTRSSALSVPLREW